MKSTLAITTTFLCLTFSGCSKKYTALESGKYYNISVDNFVDEWYVTSDSIIIVKVNFHLPQVGGAGDTIAAVKIYDVVKKHDTYNLYIDRFNNKAPQKQFSILAIKKDKDEILYTISYKSFTSLEECKKQKFVDPQEFLCFSLYRPDVYNSFSSFKSVKDMDTATVCSLIQNFRTLLEANRSKIGKIAKYDMYLSGSMKELTNRTLISMQINPVDYMDDDLRDVSKKCDKLLHD